MCEVLAGGMIGIMIDVGDIRVRRFDGVEGNRTYDHRHRPIRSVSEYSFLMFLKYLSFAKLLLSLAIQSSEELPDVIRTMIAQ